MILSCNKYHATIMICSPCVVTVMFWLMLSIRCGEFTEHVNTRPLIVLSSNCNVRVPELLTTVPSCDNHVIVLSAIEGAVQVTTDVLPIRRF